MQGRLWVVRFEGYTKGRHMSLPSSTGRTVLVVDDDADLRGLVAESLRQLGQFTVVTAEDGGQGLERYFDVHRDCVVIDVKMPGLDGYQLVRALRGDPASRATPLVILSAMVQEKDQLAGFLSGADEYLVKPVSPLRLARTIERAVGLTQEDRPSPLRRPWDPPSAQRPA